MNDDVIARKRNSRVRTHGLKYPLHPLQILSWVFYLLNFSTYYLIFMVGTTHIPTLWIILTIIYTGFVLTICVLDIWATIINPTDKVVKQKHSDKDKEKYSFFCKIWDSYVSDNSKHWGQCNRCVADFDHHWKWLNNCVGKVNYKLFIYLCFTVLLYEFYHIALMGYIIVEYSINNVEFTDSIVGVYGTDLGLFFIIIAAISIVINLCLPVIAISNLMLFHMWLYK